LDAAVAKRKKKLLSSVHPSTFTWKPTILKMDVIGPSVTAKCVPQPKYYAMISLTLCQGYKMWTFQWHQRGARVFFLSAFVDYRYTVKDISLFPHDPTLLRWRCGNQRYIITNISVTFRVINSLNYTAI
jgi:hypothetical protein